MTTTIQPNPQNTDISVCSTTEKVLQKTKRPRIGRKSTTTKEKKTSLHTQKKWRD
jgi:hypothetical protein